VSVRGRMPTLLHGPGCNLGSGRGCPLVVQYLADLQSDRCTGSVAMANITRTRNVSEFICMLVLALCLVFLSVTLLNGRPIEVVLTTSPLRSLNMERFLVSLDRGEVCSCASH